MTLADIKQKIYFLTKSNSADFDVADMLVLVNNAYERIASLLLKADARWQWDDNNFSTLPIGTITITSGQKDYGLDVTFLTLDRLELTDSNNNTRALRQIDQQDFKRGNLQALPVHLQGTGIPLEYDLLAASVFLYPTPNFTLAAALKFYFTRPPQLWSSSDLSTGTAVPGFNSLFHDLIPYWAAYEYAVTQSLKSAPFLLAAIQQKETALLEFYGSRDRDRRARFTTSTSGRSGAMSGYIGGGASDSNR